MAENTGNSQSTGETPGGSLQTSSPCKCKEEECSEGVPEWMATFADLVTLLMCFFVLMFAMSSTQQESFKELVKSLKSALGVQQIPEAGTREGLRMLQEEDPEKTNKQDTAVDELGGMVQKEVDDIANEVRELIMFNRLGGNVRVQEDEQGVIITISDVLLFPVGEADLTESGGKVIKKIYEVLSQFPYRIVIAGHTDNVPIHTNKYSSNWLLSADRACKVVQLLVNEGIDPTIISAEAFSQYHPLATNDTLKGRSKNRRVEIIYERQSISEKLSE